MKKAHSQWFNPSENTTVYVTNLLSLCIGTHGVWRQLFKNTYYLDLLTIFVISSHKCGMFLAPHHKSFVSWVSLQYKRKKLRYKPVQTWNKRLYRVFWQYFEIKMSYLQHPPPLKSFVSWVLLLYKLKNVRYKPVQMWY